MEANLGRVPFEAFEEMAHDTLLKRILQRQGKPRFLPTPFLNVFIQTCPIIG
jgi:hypothetical protein